MPTRQDYETAAGEFQALAGQAGRITAAAARSPVRQILQGGTLGRQIQDGMRRADDLVSTCIRRLGESAELCRERAAMIADYEAALEGYQVELDRYWADYDAWYDDYINWYWYPEDNSHPGSEPIAPTGPDPLPDWAEVAVRGERVVE